MPRRTKAVAKRIKNLVQSAKNRVEPYVVNTVEFVLSVLLSGATFCQSEFQFMLNNIKVPSEATFHRVQEKVGRVIIEVARESVNYWKSRMRKCSGLLFDGSWSQRRNAMFCYVQFVEEKLKKIVDWEVISKSFKNFKGNFNGKSNEMEFEGLKRMLKRWNNEKRVNFFVHDGDVKIVSTIKNTFKGIREYRDPGHFLNNIQKKLKLPEFRILSSISKNLLRWLRQLLNDTHMSIKTKKFLWLNSAKHYAGNHKFCPDPEKCKMIKPWKYAKNKTAIKTLKKFLEDTVKIFDMVKKIHSTQVVESINHIKAMLANKNINWHASWPIRMAVTILHFNESMFETIVAIRYRLNLPTMPEMMNRYFRMYDTTKDLIKAFKNSKQVQKKFAALRAIKRGLQATDDRITLKSHK
ncbi:hypothetical protein TVAG_476240 [Trichomonas vaginalis G3]|uniref:Mutator-like transposase domain-containing protein n=21 Tax=Trichomonas vaginalis (strain ATCC PRA-98 / G3) TaxID=412133 RepID=A2DA47_TRIV3|nr:zebrafish ch211-108c17.2-related family [Trichomonas vaginalis G3]XP_001330690.2 zebrafish ch211-108c17.2-related family [Trichomonas vaginalis G3]XP_001583681.1 zebrafish ch211-108c17.2-related family [Trichomonas vaginalis G3]XP_051110620.1 zebrafish ch211-108c17.2-related family [Trichomonas vaginalis G3]EAY05754.1 hypothetical protein TVAG_138230 [Trichomonas vaginalis G3]EAY10407.1 hypothetical protein TVAG_270980 [Trichomonas vaginalis G3]EAY22695.1 hypothetical protein TVAG_476240 [|eukprot:XP_001317977.1 hypothetical protein [Trichomonas vaginalis G3]